MAEKVDAYAGGGVIHRRATGTNTGPGENPPTGKAIDLTGLTTISMEDGKIVEEYVRLDLLTWMQ